MSEHHPVRTLQRRSALLLLAAAAASPALAAADADSIGQVEEVKGSAFAGPLNVRKLELSSDIILNDEVWTEAESRTTLSMVGGNKLHLGPNARLRIDTFLAHAGGELVLASGGLVFDRPETLEKTDIEVRTVFGLIGVRGTRFFAGPSRGKFGLFVDRGVVAFNAAGVMRTLEAGQGVDVAEAGGPPSDIAVWGQARIDEAFASVLG